MTHTEYLNEGDKVICQTQYEYFCDLIEFIREKGLREEFRKWAKEPRKGKQLTTNWDKK